MPVTPEGIPYQQLFQQSGGQLAYSEAFARDANQFTAFLACSWDDANDFRRELMGHTVYDPSAPDYFHRVPAMLCPYTVYARGHTMTLVNYGRMPKDADVSFFDIEAAAAAIADGIEHGNAAPAFFTDPGYQEWFVTHRAIYRVEFTRPIYQAIDDDTLFEYVSQQIGCELSRYVTRQRTNNVRELRHPDHNFKPVGQDLVLYVNGFIPVVEAEIVYTWFQVPFDKIPWTAINECRLKINDELFDDSWVFPFDGSDPYQRPGHEPETMLFVDVKGIDLPYAGSDGGLYADVQYLFRQKRIPNPEGDAFGHNHFLNAAGDWVEAERRSSPGKRVYETTDQFDALFAPEP